MFDSSTVLDRPPARSALPDIDVRHDCSHVPFDDRVRMLVGDTRHQMLSGEPMLTISVINRSALSDQELQSMVRVVNRQLAEDFRSYWHKEARLVLEGSSSRPNLENPKEMRGGAILYVVNKPTDDDTLGYHDVNLRGVPYSFVSLELARELECDVSAVLSHEALELVVDPEVNLFARGPHPTDPTREVLHWYEICDAVQDEVYEIDGIKVSNFVLPLYYTVENEDGGRNDFLGVTGKRKEPLKSFGVAVGGYVGFFDPSLGDHDTFTLEEDEKAKKILEVKARYGRTRRGARYRVGHTGSEHALAFSSVSFSLRDAPAKKQAALKVAKELTSAALGRGWLVREAPSATNLFDAIPLQANDKATALTVGEGWQLAYRMLDDERTALAEPMFDIAMRAETPASRSAPSGRRGSSLFGMKHKEGTQNKRWSLELTSIPEAWAYSEKNGLKSRGDGILIGHPDSGFRAHPELAGRIEKKLQRDFVGGDSDSHDAKGDHGLATASVIVSGEDGDVTGAAPKATLVPLRVTAPGLLKPAPVLLPANMRYLRDAVNYATDIGCHVISISLGSAPFYAETLRQAFQNAVRNDVLCFCAAGNEVRLVVWPARFEEVIAVAGCNIEKKPWPGSSRGRPVDVTAPAESVWRAEWKDGVPTAERGFGTSFAVATVAGIAACWLAHHGRDNLIKQVGKGNLQATFLRILRDHGCDPHDLDESEFGAGIVDAEKVLKAPIELPRARRGSRRPLAGASGPSLIENLSELSGISDLAALRGALSSLLGCSLGELDARLLDVGNEVVANVVVHPAFRHALALAAKQVPGRAARRGALVHGLAGLGDPKMFSARMRGVTEPLPRPTQIADGSDGGGRRGDGASEPLSPRADPSVVDGFLKAEKLAGKKKKPLPRKQKPGG